MYASQWKKAEIMTIMSRLILTGFIFVHAMAGASAQPTDAEQTIERLDKVRNGEFGEMNASPFGVQFNFHDREQVAKTVATFSSVKDHKRFQEILLKKLKRPDEVFAAYHILNETFGPEHRIDLLGGSVHRSKIIGWSTSVSVSYGEKENKFVTIGLASITAILTDHWKTQFHLIERKQASDDKK